MTGFFDELKRRRVLHIGAAYIAGAWLGAEVLSFLLEQAGAPAWSLRLLAIVLVVGFPVSVVLAWVIQVQPDGKWAVDPSSGQRRVIFGAIVLGIVATASLSWLILPRIEDPPVLPDYQPLPNSVAILPLVDVDATPNERTVAESLYNALLKGLNQSRELTQVQLRLRERPADMIAFGKRMRVAALLVGRIRPSSGGSRIEMELLDIGRNAVHWSLTLDWDPTQIMDIGTDIANGVLGAMDLPALSRTRFTGTDNAEAYDAVLLGWARAASMRSEDLVMAMENFQRAIDLDPSFVTAYISMASTISLYIHWTAPPEPERQGLRDRAIRAVEMAVKLDNQSAAAISKLGQMTENRELRIEAYQRALELNPDHGLTYFRYGWEMRADGKLEEAERLFRKALEIHPMDANMRSDLGGVLWDQGRAEEAYAEIEKSIELEPKMTQNYHKLGVWNYFDYGRLDESIINWRMSSSLDPAVGDYAVFLAGTYADLGAREEALAWLERGLELGPGSVWVWIMAMAVNFRLGDDVAAMEYAPGILELDPRNQFALDVLGERDIEAGQAELALGRWHRAYPIFTISDNPPCNGANSGGGGKSNFDAVSSYAKSLQRAGQTEKAHRLLQSCLSFLEELCPGHIAWPGGGKSFRQGGGFCWNRHRILLQLERKEETLDALRREVIDGHRRHQVSDFDRPEYDFLRDEPEFQQLMDIIKTDLAEQLQRVRELERKGELAPAPGVVIEP